MTTQTQGKGKKKNKEVMKVSLDEFNQIDAPHGHSVVNLKLTGIDWAETMADHDHQSSSESQQIIVPAAPRAQRGPGVDFDSLPNEPPFRVSVFGLPMSVEEKEICDRFFQGLDVRRVEISKASATVEFGSKDHLYEALCKDGSSIKSRTVNVCLYGQTPQSNYNSDRYGRGGNSSYDRWGDRGQGGFGGSRVGDRHGDRSGGFGRDREGGFNSSYSRNTSGGGFGQPRGSYDRTNFRDTRAQYTAGGGEPSSDESANWRAKTTVKPPPPPAQSPYNNGSRQPHARFEPSQHNQQPSPAPLHQQYQPEPYYQPRYQNPPNHSPYPQFDNQTNNRPLPSSAGEERPKLVLSKRKTPLNVDDVSSVARNEAIFGKAKPSSTPYQKMNEVEEKLKAVQIGERKESKPGSQVGSQPGSAPRSRRVSSNHSESNS